MADNLPEVSGSSLMANFQYSSMESILVDSKNEEARGEIADEIESLDILIEMMTDHIKDLTAVMAVPKAEDRPTRMHSAQSKPRVSSVYVSSQMSNLISLKNLKMSMITKKHDLRVNGLDRAFKVLSQINKDNNGGEEGAVPIAAVMEYLLRNGITMPTNPSNDMRLVLDESEESEEDIDAYIHQAIVDSGEGFLGEESGEASPIIRESPNYLAASLELDEVFVTKPKGAEYIYIDLEEEKIYFVNGQSEIVGDEIDIETFEIEQDNEGNDYSPEFGLPVFSSEVDEETE